MEYCSIFQPGDLLLGSAIDSLNYFDVECMELWAVGGDEWITECLEVQQKQWSLAESNRNRARMVDKKQFVQDFQNGLLSSEHPAGRTGYFSHHHDNANNNMDRCEV